MMRLTRNYNRAIQFVGLVLTIGMLAIALRQGVTKEVGSFLTLGIIASWLRVGLNPIGYITLTPLVSFAALLLSAAHVAVLVTVLSSVFGSRFFGRNQWRLALGEAGEEGVSMALSVGLFSLVRSQFGVASAFMTAVLAYALCRLLFTALNGRFHEISLGTTVLGTAKYLIGNITLLGIVAFAVTHAMPISSRFGFLGLGLVTVALLEFYRPWKLLSQQSQDLYSSLAIIAEAIDIKDPYTGRHSRRVAETATKLARRLSLSEHEVGAVRIGGLLHDIGKIGVSGNIIRKPASLDAREMEAMQRHPEISADIMVPVEYFRNAAYLVRHHHEHYDGTGYPDGLKAEGIPIGSRIILVADAYDALTTDRPYRKGKAPVEALEVLKERSGKQFDARVVKELEEMLSET